jgi:rare lipoprotein A
LFVAVQPTVPAVSATLAPAGIAAAGASATPSQVRTSLTVAEKELDVLEGHRATIAGALRGPGREGLSRRTIVLQSLGGHGWHTLARARTNARGQFRIRFRPETIGTRLVRVDFAGDAAEQPAHKRVGRLNVYREVGASWYGGGGTTACGGTLTSETIGVANKTLPCGTIVTLRYDGHTLSVPVIDRGPYVEGREYDLTEATKYALGFGSTGEVWATR